MSQAAFAQDLEKLIEAVLYVSERSADDPDFGMTKLVKLLYYSDCAAYILRGKPITGTTYLHFPHGPYPENWHRVRAEMEHSGVADVLRESAGAGYHRYRLLTLRPANRELLDPDELALMDEQIQRFTGFNAAAIEGYSHQELAWRATEDGEPMDYELAGVFAPPLSQNSLRRARAVADAIRRE